MPDEQLMPPSVAVREAVRILSAHGVASPRVNAEELTAYVLGVPRSRLALAPGMTGGQYARLRVLVDARAGRVPLQHLTGTAPFRHLLLSVGPGVFVPRPETELLVDWGLAAVRGIDAPVVVDLCAGSGAIALSMAQECPQATVYAVEDDPAALSWLRRNAAGSRVSIVEGDATDPAVLSTCDGGVDLVLSNPPYVPAGAFVEPEVREHDPARAVFAGPDGLDVIRRLVPRAAVLLRPGGHLAVEHDDGEQTSTVTSMLLADGLWGDVADHPDLGGRPRFATARSLAD